MTRSIRRLGLHRVGGKATPATKQHQVAAAHTASGRRRACRKGTRARPRRPRRRRRSAPASASSSPAQRGNVQGEDRAQAGSTHSRTRSTSGCRRSRDPCSRCRAAPAQQRPPLVTQQPRPRQSVALPQQQGGAGQHDQVARTGKPPGVRRRRSPARVAAPDGDPAPRQQQRRAVAWRKGWRPVRRQTQDWTRWVGDVLAARVLPYRPGRTWRAPLDPPTTPDLPLPPPDDAKTGQTSARADKATAPSPETGEDRGHPVSGRRGTRATPPRPAGRAHACRWPAGTGRTPPPLAGETRAHACRWPAMRVVEFTHVVMGRPAG